MPYRQVQRKKFHDLVREQISQMTDRDLYRIVIENVFNLHAVEITKRLIGQGQSGVEDNFVIKQVEKFIKRNVFHNRYLDEVLRRFKKIIKMPAVMVYDPDKLTLDNLRNKENDAEKAYAAWLKEVECK